MSYIETIGELVITGKVHTAHFLNKSIFDIEHLTMESINNVKKKVYWKFHSTHRLILQRRYNNNSNIAVVESILTLGNKDITYVGLHFFFISFLFIIFLL